MCITYTLILFKTFHLDPELLPTDETLQHRIWLQHIYTSQLFYSQKLIYVNKKLNQQRNIICLLRNIDNHCNKKSN